MFLPEYFKWNDTCAIEYLVMTMVIGMYYMLCLELFNSNLMIKFIYLYMKSITHIFWSQNNCNNFQC